MEESENNKNEIKEIKEVEENERENIPIDKALDIQINYLQSSVKNILYGLIANEPEVEEPKNKNIDKGIYLYLRHVYNKYYCNEIRYILGNINNKISYINDNTKKLKQNKEFYEREINTISSEKIEYFNQKETLDKELELLTVNKMQNSICKTDNSPIDTNNTENESLEVTEKKKKIEELRKKYNKLNEVMITNKKEYPIIKSKNDMIQGENMLLNEKLKQKQLIWDQMRKENEKIKTVVIKRELFKNDPDKNEDKKDENANKDKNIKVNKIGSFLKGMFGKKNK
jgi:hypothetical protein